MSNYNNIYEEMVKEAYENIVDGFDKEAALSAEQMRANRERDLVSAFADESRFGLSKKDTAKQLASNALDTTKKAIKNSGIDISEDFTLITQGPGDDGSFYPYLVGACIRMQIFNGKQIENITVTYIEVDSNGNIVDKITWPSENR